MKELAMALKAKKLKVTPQRLAIYSYLKGVTSHPTAEDIYAALKEDYPTMSLATIYKTLASLRDSQLVLELNVGDGSARYDATVNFHPHLVCRYCKNVTDYFENINLNSIKKQVEKDCEFLIEDTHLIFYGICSKCSKLNK